MHVPVHVLESTSKFKYLKVLNLVGLDLRSKTTYRTGTVAINKCKNWDLAGCH